MADVVLPQLGESVTEGTITKWFKSVGDQVEKDEPLYDVSTDKVDSEVPSPESGILVQILAKEGELVAVGQKIAVISPGGEVPSPRENVETTEETFKKTDKEYNKNEKPATLTTQIDDSPLNLDVPAVDSPINTPPVPARPPVPTPQEETDKVIASPLVRKLIRENNLDIASIKPTGPRGRITADDVKEALKQAKESPKETKEAISPPQDISSLKLPKEMEGDRVIAFSNIRKATAKHMLFSKQVAPHAMVSKEVDFEKVEKVRQQIGNDFKKLYHFSLSYSPFLARACVEALRRYPELNASVSSDSLIVHQSINLGYAVDLDLSGLIVPVIKSAENLNTLGLAKAINQVVRKAKNKELAIEDISNGTFTLSNPGPFGTFMTYPIINQPQVGVLSSDGIKRRPVVVNTDDAEAIAIHSLGILTVAFDHRAVDGVYVARFLDEISQVINEFNWVDEF